MNLRQDIQIYKAENGSNIWLMRQLFIKGRIITIESLNLLGNMHLILTKKFDLSIINSLQKIGKEII